jgi:dTMP kinase
MEIFKRLSAKFVTFEGIDGSGKSTLLNELASWLEEQAIPFIRTREPGGTQLGERLREILLDPSFEFMNHRAEVMLYSASRAQLVHEIILPALSHGTWVLADRYADATLAYQGFGRGLELEALRQIQDWGTGGLWPHLTVLLDCNVEVASRRMKGRRAKEDRIEQESRTFHQRVREGYLALARSATERFLVLDGNGELQEVLASFRKSFQEALRRSCDAGLQRD